MPVGQVCSKEVSNILASFLNGKRLSSTGRSAQSIRRPARPLNLETGSVFQKLGRCFTKLPGTCLRLRLGPDDLAAAGLLRPRRPSAVGLLRPRRPRRRRPARRPPPPRATAPPRRPAPRPSAAGLPVALRRRAAPQLACNISATGSWFLQLSHCFRSYVNYFLQRDRCLTNFFKHDHCFRNAAIVSATRPVFQELLDTGTYIGRQIGRAHV